MGADRLVIEHAQPVQGLQESVWSSVSGFFSVAMAQWRVEGVLVVVEALGTVGSYRRRRTYGDGLLLPNYDTDIAAPHKNTETHTRARGGTTQTRPLLTPSTSTPPSSHQLPLTLPPTDTPSPKTTTASLSTKPPNTAS